MDKEELILCAPALPITIRKKPRTRWASPDALSTASSGIREALGRRHRRLERGRHVEPAKLLSERDDVADDGDQRWPEVEGRLRVGKVAERADRRFLSLRCAPAD